MSSKSAAPRLIALGILAALLVAFAVFMVLSPSAPRRAKAPQAPEAPETVLTLYEGPRTMTSSQTARITANGHELFVYDIMVNHEHIWNANTQPSDTPVTYFDFDGTVDIDIEMPGLKKPVESAQVLPAAWGIVPEVADGHVRFTITEPGQYTVVYNGSVNKATHIFANAPETEVPDPDDPNVYYIGPGEWTMDAIVLTDGQTLYLSGGAVLHSIVSVANAKDVKICGRGMIDGSDYPAWNQAGSYSRVPIDLNHSKNVTVEGIMLVNSNCWNFNSYSSSHVTVDNVKIISGRQNGDGFTFMRANSRAIAMNDCSPPDSRFRFFMVFPGGAALISMSQSRGLSASDSTTSAWPPPNSSRNTSPKYLFILPKASRNISFMLPSTSSRTLVRSSREALRSSSCVFIRS